MKVAYLVSQYPKISHSFIRREIAGLEALGFEIERYSVRRTAEVLVDPADLAEAERTRVLLDVGLPGLFGHLLRTALTKPLRLARAARTALRLGWRHGRGLPVHGIYLAEACVLTSWLRKSGAEHLHAHFSTNPATVALLCHELGGPAYSFTFHGPELFQFPKYAALGEKIARARFCVAISHHGRSQLCRWSSPEHWDRIHLVHCGVDATFLDHPPTPPPEEPRLVCVARISPEKGHAVLFQAAAELVAEGLPFELVLVGDGDYRPTVEALLAKYGLDERVRFAGWLGGEGVRREILASRALVLPSFDEGLPVVFMEALALHRPVISTYIAGIPELVETGATGWVVPAGDVVSLVAAMRAVLAAPGEQLAELGCRGAERVKARHDSSREAASLGKLLRASDGEDAGRS